jgi:hypothetical protein
MQDQLASHFTKAATRGKIQTRCIRSPHDIAAQRVAALAVGAIGIGIRLRHQDTR